MTTTNDYLKQILAKTKNSAASIVADGLIADVKSFVDTGCLALNALISGSVHKGMPGNKILGFAGDPATGKTYFALSIAKNFQDQDPEAMVLIWDSESAITSDMLSDRDFDLDRVAVFPVTTIEEFRNQALAILVDYNEQKKKAKQPPLLLILDSLGMLSTSKEVTDIGEGKDTRDMTKAGLVKGAFRVLTTELAKAEVPMIVNCHTYDSIGSLYPQKILSGGMGLVYAASTIVMLSKRKERANDEIVGNVITCTLRKGRFAIENKKVELLLNYKDGLHKYFGLTDVAEKHGILKKVGNKYEFPDGTKAFESALYKTPSKFFTPTLIESIDKACGEEFLYAKGANTADDVVDTTTGEVLTQNKG